MRRCISPSRVEGEITVPGSRSIANRALVTAALASGASRLQGVPVCDDTAAMIGGLRSLGVEIRSDAGEVHVTGTAGVIGMSGAVVDAMASGTTARFLTALASLGEQQAVIDGSERLRERPLGPLLEALRAMGASVGGERLPVIVGGGRPRGGTVRIDASVSSQFVSALALIGPAISGGLTIEWGHLASRPFVETTVEVMATFGAQADLSMNRLDVSDRSHYRGADVTIPPDAASAVYPALASALTGGSVLIKGLKRVPSQADNRVFDVFEAMGCSVAWNDAGLLVAGPDRLRSIDADMSGAPDGALAVAIAAAFGDGPSTIRGLGTLAAKESDRLAGLVEGLTALGSTIENRDDALWITPGPARGTEIDPQADHRMAMAFSVAGLARNGVSVNGTGCVAKTWPRFYEDMEQIAGAGWARWDG